MDNKNKSMILNITGDISKVNKFKIYKNSNDELYIIETAPIKKTFEVIRAEDAFDNILIDVMSIAQRQPFIPYESWTEEQKEKGASEVLYFCNKYGLLGMRHYLSSNLPVYILHNKDDDNIWYPLEKEQERIKATSKYYIEEYENWGGLLFDFVSQGVPEIDEVYDILSEKYLPNDFTKEDIEKINTLFEFSKRIVSIKPPAFSRIESTEGEPVKLILDVIWYLYRYARIWSYFRENSIDIKKRYSPIECDNINRLSKNFSYPFDYGRNSNEHNKITVNWPTWNTVLEYFTHSTHINNKISKDKNGEWVYNIKFPTLFETICHLLLVEIDSNNRVFRFCKNCSELLFGEKSNKQYCSKECRNQYNVKLYRRRKKEKECKERKEGDLIE